jgi:hypothetical protein
MNTYEALVSPTYLLNEQVARQVFDILPESGPVVLIMDRQGHHWPSDSHEFSEFKISDAFLNDLKTRVDDGAEPVIAQTEQCTIVAAELSTERTRCGYIALIMKQDGPEHAMMNMDFLEIVISQVNLIAKLIEKNVLLYELQSKYTPGSTPYEAVLN